VLPRIAAAPGSLSPASSPSTFAPRKSPPAVGQAQAGKQGVLRWDDKPTLEFDDTHPSVAALEIAPAPRFGCPQELFQ
jgi:hypothetical protein